MAITVPFNTLIGTESSSAIGTTGSPLASISWASTTGNAIIVFVRWFGGSVQSVTDTAGNTYTPISAAGIVGHNTIATYLAQNITGNAANIVNVNSTAGITYALAHVAEIAGVATSGALDVATAKTSTSNSTSIVSNSFSTAQASEVAFALATANGGDVLTTVTPTIGGVTATIGSADTGHDTVMAWVVFSTTQSSITANFTNSTSDSYDISVVSLSATTGVAPDPTTLRTLSSPRLV